MVTDSYREHGGGERSHVAHDVARGWEMDRYPSSTIAKVRIYKYPPMRCIQ